MRECKVSNAFYGSGVCIDRLCAFDSINGYVNRGPGCLVGFKIKKKKKRTRRVDNAIVR